MQKVYVIFTIYLLYAIFIFCQLFDEDQIHQFFRVTTNFPVCFENSFELVLLPENCSGSTTDYGNNFSLSQDKKQVCFELKSHGPYLRDFDLTFQLAQNISVFVFRSFYY